MVNWEEELLAATSHHSDHKEVFRKIEAAARDLGFEHCAYSTRVPWPFSRPRNHLMNNYPAAWQARYQDAGYLHVDPVVAHCRKSEAPLLWSDDVFAKVPEFWREAQSYGLRFGWSQSCLDANGAGAGMFSLSRSAEPLSPEEIAAKEGKMRWLVHISHLRLARTLAPQLHAKPGSLTSREVEVLKWTGDGKTSSEISQILVLSTDTVNFHLKNAVSKLGAANKTAAVACAAMMGMLN